MWIWSAARPLWGARRRDCRRDSFGLALPALGGLLFAFVTPAVVRLLVTVQARLLRALVGQCASSS